ncbi:hypothetical protein Dda_9075 [Drechslerella dactyloides]|uniref:Uncharacterized protein n=1 Tax=Drechslerella dactyloides TaxID=74499 RepID=A0AAD6NFE2_DREDA|nr:hypothetical protein Dda_9075 [Drechslerella dactyloides]
MERSPILGQVSGWPLGRYSDSSSAGLAGPLAHQAARRPTIWQTPPATGTDSPGEPMEIDDEDVQMVGIDVGAEPEPADEPLLPVPGPVRIPRDRARERYVTQYRAPLHRQNPQALIGQQSQPYTSTPPDPYEHRCRRCLHAEEEDLSLCRDCQRTYWHRRWRGLLNQGPPGKVGDWPNTSHMHGCGEGWPEPYIMRRDVLPEEISVPETKRRRRGDTSASKQISKRYRVFGKSNDPKTWRSNREAKVIAAGEFSSHLLHVAHACQNLGTYVLSSSRLFWSFQSRLFPTLARTDIHTQLHLDEFRDAEEGPG